MDHPFVVSVLKVLYLVHLISSVHNYTNIAFGVVFTTLCSLSYVKRAQSSTLEKYFISCIVSILVHFIAAVILLIGFKTEGSTVINQTPSTKHQILQTHYNLFPTQHIHYIQFNYPQIRILMSLKNNNNKFVCILYGQVGIVLAVLNTAYKLNIFENIDPTTRTIKLMNFAHPSVLIDASKPLDDNKLFNKHINDEALDLAGILLNVSDLSDLKSSKLLCLDMENANISLFSIDAAHFQSLQRPIGTNIYDNNNNNKQIKNKNYKNKNRNSNKTSRENKKSSDKQETNDNNDDDDNTETNESIG